MLTNMVPDLSTTPVVVEKRKTYVQIIDCIFQSTSEEIVGIKIYELRYKIQSFELTNGQEDRTFKG